MKLLIVGFLSLSISVTSLAQETSKGLEADKGAPPSQEEPEISVRDASAGTNSSNKWGQAMNLLQGAYLGQKSAIEAAQCASKKYSKCLPAAMHAAMAAASLAQAKENAKTAKSSKYSMDMTDTGNYGDSASNLQDGYDTDAIENSPEVKNAQKFISSITGTELKPGKPFVYNPGAKKLLLANGKELKLSDLNSPAAMAAAGISKENIDAAMSSAKAAAADAAKKVSKYRTAGAASAEADSGGGGGSTGGLAADDALATGAVGLGGGLGIDRDPANLAGMQKNYNGEPIGVAGDSIFRMMTRRYKVKESQRAFYDESELLVGK